MSTNPTEDTPTHEADCPYLYGHNCSCLGKQDTPTPDHYTEASFREPFEQDDKQLREAINAIIQERNRFIVVQAKRVFDGLVKPQAADETNIRANREATAKILALIRSAQLQLVIELMSRSKIYAGLNPTSTEDAVPLSVLEHKKQELERLQ